MVFILQALSYQRKVFVFFFLLCLILIIIKGYVDFKLCQIFWDYLLHLLKRLLTVFDAHLGLAKVTLAAFLLWRQLAHF